MIDRVAIAVAAVLALLVLAEALFAPPHHPVFAWHRLVGWQALLGVLSCIAVVLASKALGRWLLQRPEDHDEPPPPPDELTAGGATTSGAARDRVPAGTRRGGGSDDA